MLFCGIKCVMNTRPSKQRLASLRKEAVQKSAQLGRMEGADEMRRAWAEVSREHQGENIVISFSTPSTLYIHSQSTPYSRFSNTSVVGVGWSLSRTRMALSLVLPPPWAPPVAPLAPLGPPDSWGPCAAGSVRPNRCWALKTSWTASPSRLVQFGHGLLRFCISDRQMS